MWRLLGRIPTTAAGLHRLHQRLRHLLLHHTPRLLHPHPPLPSLPAASMAPINAAAAAPRRPDPRIILYHQTHYRDRTTYVSLLPLLSGPTRLTHLILAAVHLNATPGDITLNEHAFSDPLFDPLWDELRALRTSGTKVLFMLGGAAAGTFARLDTPDAAAFEAFYAPLRALLEAYAPDGVDLDVEEPMSLRGVVRLIDRLKADFGAGFLVTLAPVAAALQGGAGISGFDYAALEAARGGSIAWYNAQFYCGWGSMQDTAGYGAVVRRGWPPEKVVAGVVTNGCNGAGWVGIETLQMVVVALVEMFPGFGGVVGWEYFNSLPGDVARPWEWVESMGTAVELGIAVAEAGILR